MFIDNGKDGFIWHMTLLKKHNHDIHVILTFIVWCSLLFVMPAILSAQEPEDEGNKLPKLGLYYKDDKGGTVNLRIVEGQFRIYYVDKDQIVISPAFKKARLDVEEFRNKTHEYSLLMKLSEDGQYLTSLRRVPPPYRFWVRLVMLHESISDNNQIFGRTQFTQ